MELKKTNYPYPIIMSGRDDVLTPVENVRYQIVKNDKLNYRIVVDFNEQNRDVQNYIEQGLARYVCEIECKSTMLLKSVMSDISHLEFTLSRHEVLERVNFKCYIAVIRPIENYRIVDMNEQYDDFKINMEPGDIIGSYGSFGFDADINYDKLNEVSTFMEIKETNEEQVSFDLEGEKIYIKMPAELFRIYKERINGQRFAHIIHSSVVYNALVYALCTLCNNPEYEEKKWARIIKTRMELEPSLARFGNLQELGAKVPLLADELLQNPYKRMFDNLISLTNDGD